MKETCLADIYRQALQEKELEERIEMLNKEVTMRQENLNEFITRNRHEPKTGRYGETTWYGAGLEFRKSLLRFFVAELNKARDQLAAHK